MAIEFFKHPKAKIGFLVAFLGLIFLSAKLTATSFGYATLFLFLSIFILFTENIARLGILRGDRFIIGTLLASLIVLCVFILFPMFSILSAIVYINGKFSLDEAFRTSQQPHLLKVIWQSISVSASVGLLSTFFGLCFALYTTRIAKKMKFISKLFSILPIVTPPFVVGLGVVLLMGRNGTITHFLVEQFGINKNWLYGFNGILLSHTLALTPMAF
ncbi:MAG: iron ABC transporter permease, partial [Haemophilus paraphrohaemolyticus]|nr:iron ABC transporter permease [Haemophilus paraphrohaemolyticus]